MLKKTILRIEKGEFVLRLEKNYSQKKVIVEEEINGKN